jgi:NADH-quinone oxidoreductase subunit F
MSIKGILEGFAKDRKGLLPILLALVKEKGHLSPADIEEVGSYLDLSENEVYSVASFYALSFDASPASTPETSLSAIERGEPGPVRHGEVRVLLRNAGRIDPEEIDDCYGGLRKARSMAPSEALAMIEGGGVPTENLRALAGRRAERSLICNGCDPMGTILLDNDPHGVLQGLLIASHACFAERGLICVNGSDALAASRLERILSQTAGCGLLDLPVEIRRLPPALLLLEDRALISALEGRRAAPGGPVPSPEVYPAETFARISAIFGEDYRETKLFFLTGDIAHPGLVEVPANKTLREILFGPGGGVVEGRAFKAVRAGGLTGEWFPERRLDEVVPGGSLAVAAADKCAVDLALKALVLLTAELCGKCVYCREGTIQMVEILKDIAEGRGRPSDVDVLLDIGEGMQKGSLCGLGRNAANPVLSSLREFRDDYEAHIKERRCPARP